MGDNLLNLLGEKHFCPASKEQSRTSKTQQVYNSNANDHDACIDKGHTTRARHAPHKGQLVRSKAAWKKHAHQDGQAARR